MTTYDGPGTCGQQDPTGTYRCRGNVGHPPPCTWPEPTPVDGGLDDSQAAHDHLVAYLTREALTVNLADDDNAYYVQSFVIGKEGAPATAWRWDSGEQDFVRIPIGDLTAELRAADLPPPSDPLAILHARLADAGWTVHLEPLGPGRWAIRVDLYGSDSSDGIVAFLDPDRTVDFLLITECDSDDGMFDVGAYSSDQVWLSTVDGVQTAQVSLQFWNDGVADPETPMTEWTADDLVAWDIEIDPTLPRLEKP